MDHSHNSARIIASGTECDGRDGKGHSSAGHGHDEGCRGYDRAWWDGRYQSNCPSLWGSQPAGGSDSQGLAPNRSTWQGGLAPFAGGNQTVQTGCGVGRQGRSRSKFKSGDQGPRGSPRSCEAPGSPQREWRLISYRCGVEDWSPLVGANGLTAFWSRPGS